MLFIHDMNSWGKKKKNQAHVPGDFHRKVPGFARTRKSPVMVIRLRSFHKELEEGDFSFFFFDTF